MSFLRSSHAPRHYKSPMQPYIRSMPHLPFEVFLLVLSYEQSSPSLLAKLCLLNSEIYKIVVPYLYRKVLLDRGNWDKFLWGFRDEDRPKIGPGSFVFKPPKELLDGLSNAKLQEGSYRNNRRSTLDERDSSSGDFTSKNDRRKSKLVVPVEPNEATERRKRQAFSMIRILVIIDIPNVTTSQTLSFLANPPLHSTPSEKSSFSPKPGSLFSGIRKLVIHSHVLYSLSEWKHYSVKDTFQRYTKIHEHDFIKALKGALPTYTNNDTSISSDPPPYSYHPDENHVYDGFEVEIIGSLCKSSRYMSYSTSEYLNSSQIPSTEVFKYSKEILENLINDSNWRMRKFTWHNLTLENLPFLSIPKNKSFMGEIVIEYHFVQPSHKTITNFGNLWDTQTKNIGVDILSRAIEIRSILLKSIEQNLIHQKYKFIGSGLGILFEFPKIELEIQEKLMGLVKNSNTLNTIGGGVLDDGYWNTNVRFITSTSGLLTSEERIERGYEGGGDEDWCDCYPAIAKVESLEDGKE